MILNEIYNLIEESKKGKLLKYATLASIPTGAYLYGKVSGADEAKMTATKAGIKAATDTANTLFNDRVVKNIPTKAALASLAVGAGLGYHLTKKKKETPDEFYSPPSPTPINI
jgi:hypothetical protein